MKRETTLLPDGGLRLVYEFTANEIDAAERLADVDDATLAALARAFAHRLQDPPSGPRYAAAFLVLVRACTENFVDGFELVSDEVRIRDVPAGRWRLQLQRVETPD